jgi:hypothetical protein
MTAEERERFKAVACLTKLRADAVWTALRNWDAVQAFSEKFLLSYLARYDLVCAVWLVNSYLEVRIVKGPDELTQIEQLPPGAKTNAIPVADEAEAIRWQQLFEGALSPRARAMPRLATADGTSTNPDQVLQRQIAEFWERALEGALIKNRTFESPRDDEMIANLAANCDVATAVWPDPAGTNGYSMLAIQMVEIAEPRDLRMNSFMTLDRATATKWQAQFGIGDPLR